MFTCVCTPRALAYVHTQPLRHGVIERTTGGSLARSWPPSLPRRRRCCVLLLLLLGLSAAAAANNRRVVLASAFASVDTFVYSVCACSRMYEASSRELWERHALCDILLSLLLYTGSAAAPPASASTYCRHRRRCCCCRLSWFFENRCPGGGKKSLRHKMGQPVERSLLDL